MCIFSKLNMKMLTVLGVILCAVVIGKFYKFILSNMLG